MSTEIVSSGEDFKVKYLNRTFGGGPPIEILKVSGDPATPGVATVKGQPIQAYTKLLQGYAVGLSSAGSVVVAGTKVGDKVVQVLETTTPFTDVTADFEAVCSVAGHVAQTTADLHLFTLLFVIQQQS